MEEYIKNHIFKDNLSRYDELVKLNEQLEKMKVHKKPFLIEFLGSARSGKSTSIELIADVLRKHGMRVLVVDEETVKLTKEINKNRSKKMSVDSLDYTNQVIEEKILLYDSFYQKEEDIIIFDRGINDEFIWLDTFGATNDRLKEYDKILEERYVDTLIIQICDVDVSLERKYFNSLSILPNKWTNEETLTKYLNGIDRVSRYFKKHTHKIHKLDSSKTDKVGIAIEICMQIINDINK